MADTQPNPKLTRDDFSDILPVFHDRNWERVKSLGVPTAGDEEIIRTIPDIPIAKVERCRQFADLFTDAKNVAQQRYVVDPVVDRETKKGVYRCVSNEVSRLNAGFKGIVQTLRKGFARELVWSEARIVSQHRADSNATDVTGVTGSASDNPQRYFVLEFPNCDNGYVSTIAASAAATYATFTAEGQTVTGAFHTLIRSGKKGDDGAGTVTLVLAEPQYTLTGFADYLGSNSKSVHYLNEVPQTIAQTILDAWKTGEGRTAQMRSYNNESKTVDIALWSYAGTAPNLTVSAFKEHCDTTTSIYFAWRYTETQVGSFFSSHPAPSDMTGVTRKVQVNERGDGFFDVTIFQTTVTYAANKHKVLFDVLGSAGYVVKQAEWGWNLPMDTLTALETKYNATTLGDGYVTDFKVKRNENCTFDFEGLIVQEKYRSLLTSKSGTKYEPVTILVGESAKTTELPATLAQTPVQGEERSASIKIRENNLIDFVVTQKMNAPYALTKSVSGGDKHTKVEHESKYNQTASTALLAQPTAKGVTVIGQIKANPNDTFDAESKIETRERFELTEQVAGGSITEEVKIEKVIAAQEAPKIDQPTERGIQVEAEITKHSDDTIDHTKRTITAKKTAGPDLIDGGWKAKRETSQGINYDPDDVEDENYTTLTRGVMTRLVGRMNPANGVVDWYKEEITSTARNWGAYSISNDGVATILIKAEWYINQLTLPDFNVNTMTFGTTPTCDAGTEIEYREVEMNDDGTFNYIKITTTVTLTDSAKTGIIIKASDEVVRDERFVHSAVRTTGIVSAILISTTRWIELVLYNRVCRVTSTVTRKFSTSYPALNSADYTVGDPNNGTNNGTSKHAEIVQLTRNLYAVDVYYTYRTPWEDNTGSGLLGGIRTVQRELPPPPSWAYPS